MIFYFIFIFLGGEGDEVYLNEMYSIYGVLGYTYISPPPQICNATLFGHNYVEQYPSHM